MGWLWVEFEKRVNKKTKALKNLKMSGKILKLGKRTHWIVGVGLKRLIFKSFFYWFWKYISETVLINLVI